MKTILIPDLNEGETYITTLFDVGSQKGYHLVLLPGDSDSARWQKQMEWAKQLGGDLPTRIEQALLFEKQREQFKEDWYWSNETDSSGSVLAWFQTLTSGYQRYYHEYNEHRSRAVRRLPAYKAQ